MEVAAKGIKAEKMKEIGDIKAYKGYIRHKRRIMWLMLAINIVLMIVALNAGSFKLSRKEIMETLLGGGDISSNLVIWKLRLPRVISAVVAGAGLSVTGCIMQTNLRNQLASPSTLGISNAAAFGANLAIIVFGAGRIGSNSMDAVKINLPYLVTICAFISALLASLLVIVLSKIKDFQPEVIVLAGVAVGSLFSAGTIAIQYFATDDSQIAAAVFWSFGDLGRINWTELIILAVVTLLSVVYFLFHRWDYNAIETGDESAKSLGVNVNAVRIISMALGSLITAVAVSFLGVIGFIGLIGPQMMKRIMGNDHRFLLISSALAGSMLLLAADTIARTIIAPVILPVGIVTSFLGSPLFLYVLLKSYK